MMKFFFDVDGVLIKGYSPNPDLHRPWDQNLQHDLGIDPLLFKSEFINKRFASVICGQADLEEQLNAFTDEVNASVRGKDLLEYWLANDSIINDVTFEWLDQSRIAKENLFLATNQEKNRADHLWNKLNFNRYFSEIFNSGKVGFSKSHQEFFGHIKTATGFDQTQCVLIDDSPDVIKVAQAFGWHTILFEGPESLQKLNQYL